MNMNEFTLTESEKCYIFPLNMVQIRDISTKHSIEREKMVARKQYNAQMNRFHILVSESRGCP